MQSRVGQIDLQLFRKAIIAWGRQNFREFPWRTTNNPYQLLMAEVMLHRTQALQVVPVYKKFLGQYPELTDLAAAREEDLTEVLYPLGLHWRIKLVHEMSADLMSRFQGQIPVDKADLLSLPGVSDYIASAVRCFAWNMPEALIDTNTVRIVGRLFKLKIKDSSRRNPVFKELISTLVDLDNPKVYNYALLDLASKICTKVQPPLCESCPVNNLCAYPATRTEDPCKTQDECSPRDA